MAPSASLKAPHLQAQCSSFPCPTPHVQSGGAGEGFEVQKYGDGRVALIGFPSVGKSTLLTQLTGTKSEAANYEFTTLTCIPGVIHYNDAKIQLLDLPGIIEGAAEGKGTPGGPGCRRAVNWPARIAWKGEGVAAAQALILHPLLPTRWQAGGGRSSPCASLPTCC